MPCDTTGRDCWLASWLFVRPQSVHVIGSGPDKYLSASATSHLTLVRCHGRYADHAKFLLSVSTTSSTALKQASCASQSATVGPGPSHRAVRSWSDLRNGQDPACESCCR
jgi:hypothetical protein